MLVVHHDDPDAIAMAESLRGDATRLVVTTRARLEPADAMTLAGSIDVALLPPESDLALLRCFQGDDTPCAMLWTKFPEAALERLAARLELDGTAPVAPATATEAAIARCLAQRARSSPVVLPRGQRVVARWMWDAVSRRLRVDAQAHLPLGREELREILRRDVAQVLKRQVTSFHHDHEVDVLGVALLASIRGEVRKMPSGHATVRGTMTLTPVSEARDRADVDALTGLPGRGSFLEALLVAQERGLRDGHTYAVLALDLDNLGAINDGFGHGVGDRLLRWTANRLCDILPHRVVARIGNDEFAVLLRADAPEAPDVVAKRVLDALSQAVSLDHHLVYPSAKAGLAIADAHTAQVDAPLRDALSALAQAKQSQTSRLISFNGALRAQHLAVIQLDRDLRHAVATKQLLLHFQPIVGLVDGRTHGFEALLRWPHPERGWVSPDEFVAHAERTGMILPLGRWVLEESCRALVRVRRSTPALAHAYVSVNLSPLQLHQPDLVAIVEAALKATHLDASALRLELTESSLMSHGEETLEVLQQLRDLGVQILIDDFGTGYSSLHYLARLPADILKVDRSFIDGLGADPRKTRVVCTIVDLAGSLGMRVVAEGVETQNQLDWVRRLGIDAGQGYLFGRPVPEQQLRASVATTLDAEDAHTD